MRLYDSLSRRKEELPPPPGPVRMYVCGPTVYQRIHVGNARPYVIFLWLRRWLELQGYDVTLVENVTDVNDKIYDAARAQGIPSAKLARQATEWYFADTGDLGLGRPDVEPLATETIPEIAALIEELVERGLAYESSGDVYFRVARFPGYGALSGANVDDMVAQEPSDLKEDPRDFALWKATKPNEDTWWDSPWGRGRPGWHIECSAMAEKHLGPSFEIHGGGLDLRFPHHENEIAQSRGAGREFARMWVHNGMLEFAAEKMSKSLGNIVSLREALDRWGREPLLLLFAGAHYRSPVEFSDESMLAASGQWIAFQGAFRVPEASPCPGEWKRLAAALEDDFNTAAALAVLHEWRARGYWDLLKLGLDIFGLRLPEFVKTGPPVAVLKKVEQRERARQRGDFPTADRLREDVWVEGWEIQDLEDGPRVIRRL